jgi:peptidoglycan/LPS O-acetylase OafA/YrhL
MIAALSIVYYHSWTSIVRFPEGTSHQIPGLTTYGWFGVDLFFAISGYVICLVVSRGNFNVPSFLIKRVFRLYPLWLVMLTTFALTAALWRGLQPRESMEFFSIPRRYYRPQVTHFTMSAGASSTRLRSISLWLRLCPCSAFERLPFSCLFPRSLRI